MSKLKVLVVDDEQSAQIVAGTLLQTRGCEIQSALNGREATRLLINEIFDLVLLDWEMPILKGSETLIETEKLMSRLRPQLIRNRLPLVLYTSVSPNFLDLPHVECFQLIDYWNKHDGLNILKKQAENVVDRITRRKNESVG